MGLIALFTSDLTSKHSSELFICLWDVSRSNHLISTVDHAMNNTDYEAERCDPARAHTAVLSNLTMVRRHLEDIYDLCWSPDNQALISGSVDHSVIVWQLDLAHVVRSVSPTKSSHNETSSATNVGPAGDAVSTGTIAPTPAASSLGTGNTKCLIVRDHKHYVQGVTWDPLGFYVASLSSDRACRIYRAGTRNCLAHVAKAGKQRLFQQYVLCGVSRAHRIPKGDCHVIPAKNTRRPISTNPVSTTTEQSPANAGSDAAVPADEQSPAVEEHRTLRQANLEVVEIKTLTSEPSVGASSIPVENLSINAPAASCAQFQPVKKRRVPFTTLSVVNQPAVGSTTCNQSTPEQLTSNNNPSGETQSAAIKHSVDSVQKRRVPFVTLELHTTSASGATEQHKTALTSSLLSSSDFSEKVSNTPSNDGCQKANDAIPSSSQSYHSNDCTSPVLVIDNSCLT
ncbi:hypothetical protein AHF37_08701 [Paragonimus kellicotti]|nr:hypothetical protein AHF37_08701 [Paragonimus kellicotti]